MKRIGLVAAATFTGLLLSRAAGAQTSAPPSLINTDPATTEAYWTADRLANAQPMPMPAVGSVAESSELESAPESQISEPGSPPTIRVAPSNGLLFTPVPRESEESIVPNLYGSVGYRFTSSRLVTDAVASLGGEKTYPYTIEGQLAFVIPSGTTQPPGDYLCSATVQRLGVITTAGHCVNDGSGHFYTNWVFIPATRSGSAPYGEWTAREVITTTTWSKGGGTAPNAQDVAVIVLNPNSSAEKIGSYTGYAGYSIPDLYAGQHLTLLGYPCNLDNCEKDHRVDAQAYGGSDNTDLVGTDTAGGESGGGWIVNFGEYASGQPVSGASDTILNALVAVDSYRTSDVLDNGASVLDTRYVQCSPVNTCNKSPTAILNYACVHNPGYC